MGISRATYTMYMEMSPCYFVMDVPHATVNGHVPELLVPSHEHAPLLPVKGYTSMNFFFTFFSETKTLWSQGPVTRYFWKSYSIRLRYSTFKHFRACSAWDEIGS
jgi:hypothetical protein